MVRCPSETVGPYLGAGRGLFFGRTTKPARHRRSHPGGAEVLPCRATGVTRHLGGLLVMAHVAAVAIHQALVVVGFAFGFNCTGRRRAQWWAASVLWRVASDGLLRPGEMLLLKRRAVKLPDDLLALDIASCVNNRGTQESEAFGQTPVCVDHGPVTINWLRWLVKPLHGASRATAVEARRNHRGCASMLPLLGPLQMKTRDSESSR
ncbi:unnamed protein product [Polarella glacialis]|uniref:Uncharacterized protein n=1 Tax=Polarella glacialis TaxID=89957 RepID=A0A813J0J6_POLGL|nr:unnamed protein product [Polarella glacialis]